jgi:miniconductance mechanosensitive channel
VDALREWFATHPAASSLTATIALLLAAWVGDRIAKRFLFRALRKLVERSPFEWDDALLDDRVLARAAHVVPVLILYIGLPLVPVMSGDFREIITGGFGAAIIALLAFVVSGLLDGVARAYALRPDAAERPIKGYIQLVQIGVFIVAGVLVLSTLTGRNPGVLLGGIGAFTAVLLLVFRDTILSLVASLQLTSNDMVRIGDWIEMPKYGADGDVIEIALHTVKIQNWDKTITTIPTHKLIEDSFRNWRGMSESGGRRIKRSLNLDMNAVRFLTPAEIEEFSRWELLRDYMAGKRERLRQWRAENPAEEGVIAETRNLTNLGTFRAYVLAYLRAHPRIHDEMTLLVRQLEPGPEGIPLQVYAFTNDTRWATYEGIQGDIFDHLLALLPEFGLRPFQAPAGADVQGLKTGGGENP